MNKSEIIMVEHICIPEEGEYAEHMITNFDENHIKEAIEMENDGRASFCNEFKNDILRALIEDYNGTSYMKGNAVYFNLYNEIPFKITIERQETLENPALIEIEQTLEDEGNPQK